MHDQFRRTGGAENHADAALVDVLEVAAGGVFQYLLRHDQAEQLAGVGLLDDIGRHAVGQRIEGHGVQERAGLAIGFVGGGGIGIVIIFDQPVVGGDILDLVADLRRCCARSRAHRSNPERAR
jgi:hypothetical protein